MPEVAVHVVLVPVEQRAGGSPEHRQLWCMRLELRSSESTGGALGALVLVHAGVHFAKLNQILRFKLRVLSLEFSLKVLALSGQVPQVVLRVVQADELLLRWLADQEVALELSNRSQVLLLLVLFLMVPVLRKDLVAKDLEGVLILSWQVLGAVDAHCSAHRRVSLAQPLHDLLLLLGRVPLPALPSAALPGLASSRL